MNLKRVTQLHSLCLCNKSVQFFSCGGGGEREKIYHCTKSNVHERFQTHSSHIHQFEQFKDSFCFRLIFDFWFDATCDVCIQPLQIAVQNEEEAPKCCILIIFYAILDVIFAIDILCTRSKDTVFKSMLSRTKNY